VPFEKLVEEFQPDRSAGRNPLVQVVLSFHNAPAEAFELPQLKINSFGFDDTLSKWDLVLFVSETDEGLGCAWRYSTDLFDASTIERLTVHFTTLLRSIVADPDAPLSKLEMLTEAERSQLKMEQEKRRESKFSKFKNASPKPVSLAGEELVRTRYLEDGQTLPLVVEPATDDVDLADWARNNAARVESQLHQHGAVLFRGFRLRSVAEFEAAALALCPQLFGDYGDLPREEMGSKVYGSTPYPHDQAILFHNESSHLHQWPMKIHFFCVRAAERGGETPIVDCRRLYELLDPRLRELFARKGLTYVRNFTKQLDVSWQKFFHTTERAVVEERCRREGIEFEWKGADGLRTRQHCRAVARHPRTGEHVFFNQIQLHHVHSLDPAVRASLLSLFGEQDLPRHVYFGDGSPIDASIVEEVTDLCWRTASKFPWQEGDLLMLDNMLVAHARNPFEGERKIVVAMGEMFTPSEA
jgi:alpha-ketoglutarate-dependent taurine dioxygenase